MKDLIRYGLGKFCRIRNKTENKAASNSQRNKQRITNRGKRRWKRLLGAVKDSFDTSFSGKKNRGEIGENGKRNILKANRSNSEICFSVENRKLSFST